MKPYYEHKGITIYHGDCREVIEDLRQAVVELRAERDAARRELAIAREQVSVLDDRIEMVRDLAMGMHSQSDLWGALRILDGPEPEEG